MRAETHRKAGGAPLSQLTFERLRHFWAVRSLLVGGLATGVDLTVLIALVQLGHVNPVLGAMVGVVVGGTANFFLNKYFAFRDHDPQVGRQALRYAVGTGIALGLHAGVVYTLTAQLGVNYIVAKLAADVLVFSVGGLLLNRYVVFPERPALAEEAGRTLACLSLAAAFTGTPALGGSAPQASAFVQPLGPSSDQSPTAFELPAAEAEATVALVRLATEPSPSAEATPLVDLRRFAPPQSPELEPRRRPPKSA
ncbi:MAG: GtrA family protein [Deltaproteobacteria bacterium]